MRFALIGPGDPEAVVNSEAFVNGGFSWANASRDWLMVMALAKTGGGTIVGRLVSMVMGSGHLCADLIRIIDLSTLASRKEV